jgi:hypothetical protein
VSYKGSKFGKTISTDGTAQEWTLTFEVVTFSRNLRTHVGAYAVMDEIRRAVSGWWAPGAINNAYPTKEGFVGEEDGVWSFATYIEVPSISVQEGNTDETDIPLVDPSTIPPTGGGSSPGTIPSLKSVTSYLENL